MPRLTPSDYVEAIKKHHGLVSVVAESLGVDRAAVYRARERHPTVAQALEEARERTIDHVESKLMGRIDSGDTTAMIFFLKTQAKHRGYVERQEVNATVAGDIVVDLVEVPDAGRSSE